MWWSNKIVPSLIKDFEFNSEYEKMCSNADIECRICNEPKQKIGKVKSKVVGERVYTKINKYEFALDIYIIYDYH